MSLERLDHIAAGVVFDFAAYLTTRSERTVLSATDNAAPAADAVAAFLKLRGVEYDAPFFQWQARCGGGHATAAGTALEILKSAMRDDPGYAWTWHCNIATSMTDEGAPHDSANASAARFMRLAFEVDTSGGPCGTEVGRDG